ncbi:hypothetical protein ACFX4W_17275 [Priestia sp. YIM B13489]
MIGGQGEDSCGNSGTGENPAGAQATRRLSGRSRKAKPCTEINCGRASRPDCSPLNGIHFVTSQPLFYYF